jgi:hypothetical protein
VYFFLQAGKSICFEWDFGAKNTIGRENFAEKWQKIIFFLSESGFSGLQYEQDCK